ncbi:hypothetical protein BDZ45DRAFT_721996 [Acephala macrosclerotiorum]|nr:hypothetical protein BDZ45DRAFT_721996 [Acephala macrosclerotiorum]
MLTTRGSVTFGTTRRQTYHDHDTRVYIAFELLEPLMASNLNSAERALEIFRAANTVLHETGHAMWDIWGNPSSSPIPPFEPFFEDESTSWDTIWHSQYTESFPVRQPVHRDYYRKDEWPIPILWFFKIHDPEFWNVFVRHFGGESVRMGPKTMGNRQDVPDTTVGRPKKTAPGSVFTRPWHQSDLVKLSVVTGIMSPDEIAATEYENKRRNYTQYLMEVMYDQDKEMLRKNTVLPQALMVGPPSKQPAANSPNPPNPPPPPPPGPIPDAVPKPPRFDEIENYLISKYQRLAFNSLNFSIPEHTLYNYILVEGGISLTATEWREFLVCCNQISPHLFLYRRSGVSTGVVTKIMNGWPSPSDPKGVKLVERGRPDGFVRPSTEAMKAFTKYAQRTINNSDSMFKDGFLDHDIEDFRVHFNTHYAELAPHRRLKKRFGSRIDEFSTTLFEACLFQDYRNKNMFTYGPYASGVLRSLKPPPGPRKPVVKGDVCPTM